MKLILGDCLEKLKELPDNSVDSIVTDPPYGLGFMNKEWDSPEKLKKNLEHHKNKTDERGKAGFSPLPFERYGGKKEGQWFQQWCEEWGKECLRVLKPGGYLLSFSAPRMYHRMTTGLEDSGFEIRDQIMWIFGSGFPKSRNMGEGWGTAMKPAHEPIVVARKPFKGTVKNNMLEWGTGGINIDDCRIGGETGRWPANVIFDEDAGKELDQQSGISGTNKKKVGNRDGFLNSNHTFELHNDRTSQRIESYGDKGGASRFFYCPKASKKDREDMNNHPTVKPTDLMLYLIKLVTPKNGTVLEPFMGSGSTGKAAIRGGFDFIGIEKEEEYLNIAKTRIEHELHTKTKKREGKIND
jgi:site-specific DNA-methyltransferase (adenine-specific)